MLDKLLVRLIKQLAADMKEREKYRKVIGLKGLPPPHHEKGVSTHVIFNSNHLGPHSVKSEQPASGVKKSCLPI